MASATIPSTQPAEQGPPPDVVREAPEGPGRRRWLWRAFVAAAVVALLVECVVLVRSYRSSDDDRVGVASVAPLVAPPELPAQGTLVTSVVRDDGTVAVTEWLRSTEGLEQITLSAPTLDSSDTARARHLRLVGADGSVLADGVTVTDRPERVRFDPTRLLRATYVLDGVTDRSDTVAGRLLVNALWLHTEGDAEPGPTVVMVSAADGGTVRNLACADARSPVTLVRPCGTPIADQWRLRLGAADPTERVQAQVDAG